MVSPSSCSSLLSGCKFTYFNLPGRGESVRLALAIGGIPFQDERIEFQDWPTVKPTTPWGSLPVLTLSDGGSIAQQRAMLRLVGAETGLYPTSEEHHLKAALIDSLMDAFEDVGTKIYQQGQGLEQEAKEAARAASVAKGGVIHDMILRLEEFVAKHGSSSGDGAYYHAVGDSITIADLFAFAMCGHFVSGMFDGVQADALEQEGDFPKLTAIRRTVRSHPAVVTWYDGLDDAIVKMPPSFGPFN